MDWILAPVMAGLVRYESLKDCSLDLWDIALLNEALEVKFENEARDYAAAKSEG